MPRIQRHRPLGEPEPLGRREHDHVAVPVGAARQGLHHFAPIRLHGVQVRHRDSEEPATQPVVDPRDEALFVVPLLGAGHEVRFVRDDRLHQCGNVGRPILQVRGIEHEDAAAGRVGAGLEGVGDAAPAAVGDDPDEGVLGGQLVQHVGGAVAAAVVDHDDLAGVGERQQRFAGLTYELGEIPGFILRRDQHAHLGRDGRRGEAHSRLRMRAGRIPS